MNKHNENYIRYIKDFISMIKFNHRTTFRFLNTLWAFQIFGVIYILFIESNLSLKLLLVVNSIIVAYFQRMYFEEKAIIDKMEDEISQI